MSRKKDDLLHKKDINTLDDALDYIEKLKSRIMKIEKSNKNLRSSNKVLKKDWSKTEIYLEDITGKKPLQEVIRAVQVDGKLQEDNYSCEKCNSKKIKKLLYSKFYILVCESCNHRDKVDEDLGE